MISSDYSSKSDYPLVQRNILLDIEGTTTSISFVKDILFQYVRENLKKYIEEHWSEPSFQSVVDLLKNQAVQDMETGIEGVVLIEEDNKIETLYENVIWQMNNDRKTNSLKLLQGNIWKQGYEDGTLKGHVFPDVMRNLVLWKSLGHKLYVYSSGSVEAQRLLFTHSIEGDLSFLFSGYFDTSVGAKVEVASYSRIAHDIGCPTNEICFLTDMEKEADAAALAGCETFIVQRPGNSAITVFGQKRFKSIGTFDQLIPDRPGDYSPVETSDHEIGQS